jgi:Lrp/AsnC family leucine-responsive transcriptional regulator
MKLDQIDEALLKALIEDGRKSFRAISREIKVSTPTVKARYDRLVNIGLIRSVAPVIDYSKISKISTLRSANLRRLQNHRKHPMDSVKDLTVKIECDFCHGPVHDEPKVLKFARFERYFCCTECRASYKRKHGARIEMLKRQHGTG